ncbi:MAG: ATP synthase F1 subunit delta [Marinilabiliales bacterium]
MNYSKITVRYAKAIFLLAKEKNLVDNIKDDMLLISNTLNKTPELNDLLNNPTIQPSLKEKSLKLIFEKNINELTFNLLRLIIRNKREHFIKNISRYFIELYKKDKGIKSVKLTTAYKPNESLIAELKKLIIEIYKSKIDLETQIDDSIIGGFVISVDDMKLDASVRKTLKDFEKALINTSFEYKILG